MENIKENYRAHILVVPYPNQGHISPMLQFCRRLVSKGIKASLAITKYISTTQNPKSDGHVNLITFSDGYDDGGFSAAASIPDYLISLEANGSNDIGNIIKEHSGTKSPITCIVYDTLLPWSLDVGKKYGILRAAFFTHACAVTYNFYLTYHGKFSMPVSSMTPADSPGLPPMGVNDIPSFVAYPESYPAYLELSLNQCSNLDKADFLLINSVYKLEDKVVDAMSKVCVLSTIGPTIPSIYVDNRIAAHDRDYGISLYHHDRTPTINWLNNKPPRSVVYVSFGSMASLSKNQMEELAWGLKQSNYYFLWVVRASEEGKLPEGYSDEVTAKGFIVRWCPQLEVLNNEAIGCFLTHCGWNSTLEALVMGVPMIGMPQWIDQPTVAKFVEDVWKVGVRVKVNEDGVVKREELVGRIKEVMVGERSGELVKNAMKWKHLVKDAISQGGSSDINIDEFVSKIGRSIINS